MTQQLKEDKMQELISRILLGYLGSPDDIAEVIAFLASEEAKYITEQVLAIDSGMT